MSPTIDGILLLCAMQAELPPMGFINPFLYKALAAQRAGKTGKDGSSTPFSDITQGDNKYHKGWPGYTAAVGWDPVSGCGAPNLAVLAEWAVGGIPQH